jgi:hypothetical protein
MKVNGPFPSATTRFVATTKPSRVLHALALFTLAGAFTTALAPSLTAAPEVFLTVHEHQDDEYLVNKPIFLRLRANTDEVSGTVEETKFWVISPDGSYNWWPTFSGGRMTVGEYSVVDSRKDTEVNRGAEFTPSRTGTWQFRSTALINGNWYYSDIKSVTVTASPKPAAPRADNTITVKRVAYKDFYTLSEFYVGNDTSPTAYAWEAPFNYPQVRPQSRGELNAVSDGL